MKHYLFASLFMLLALPTLSSCDLFGRMMFGETFSVSNGGMHFSADGGSDETYIVRMGEKKPIKGVAYWNFCEVYTSDDKDMSKIIVLQDKETELPDGTYMVDAGWAKFYYPKSKNKIRVEVEPNPSRKKRELCFDGGGGPEYYVSISVTQDGRFEN